MDQLELFLSVFLLFAGITVVVVVVIFLYSKFISFLYRAGLISRERFERWR